MLSKQQVSDRVWVIYGDTKQEIAKAFIRFQEYYENEKLRGNINLTVKDVEAWWDISKQQQDTDDSYYEYWQGFNLPGSVIYELISNPSFRKSHDETFSVRFHPEEEQLIKLIKEQPDKEIVAGYYIGLAKNAEHVYDHEVAHALYATNHNYRSTQINNIARLPKEIFDNIRKDLVSMGYHSSVILDEIQAYLSSYTETLSEIFCTDIYTKYTTPFVETFKAYSTFERKTIVIDKVKEQMDKMPL